MSKLEDIEAVVIKATEIAKTVETVATQVSVVSDTATKVLNGETVESSGKSNEIITAAVTTVTAGKSVFALAKLAYMKFKSVLSK